MSEIAGSFGEILARCRNTAGLVQRQLEDKKLGLSYSFIAQLEKGHRGKKRVPLNRAQIWFLVKRMELWPPKNDLLDDFLEAAGMSHDRTTAEEQDIQKHSDFNELWVFARILLDSDERWYKIVKNNIAERNITYRYFTTSEWRSAFRMLFERLKQDGVSEKILASRLECTLLPRQLFITNFAIYVTSDGKKYCCGTKPVDGRGATFYTMDASEANRLYEMLHGWRNNITVGDPILLSPANQIYPPGKKSPFLTE